MYAGRVAELASVADTRQRVFHPYTASLLAALPRLDQKQGERLATILGSPPVAGEIPAGCAFHPRCWLRSGRTLCVTTRPELAQYANEGHFAACHFGEETPTARQRFALSSPVTVGAESPPLPIGHADTSASPVLRVEGLVKHFRSGGGAFSRGHGVVHALDGVTFDLLHGETLAVVGETGCGKSTLARTLVLLESPTSGRITLRDTEITSSGRGGRRMLRQSVQLVFQDPYASLDPRMTIAEIIAEPLRAQRIGGRGSRAQRVSELLDLVGLSQRFIERKPHEFSGGQRQRIGIARALAVQPSIILCDEPVSSLDVSVRAQIINLLRELQEQLGVAYLFITHDLSIVPTVASRIMVMYLGQIIEQGPVEDVLGDPQHPYTVGLLAAVPSRLETRRRQTHLPRGEPASPLAPPSGCRYRTRCWKAQEICADKAPPLLQSPPGRWVACHFPEGNRDGSPSIEKHEIDIS
jgi:peptide/nickel transport system ATP-binding protein